MPQLQLALLCQRVITDQETNSVSYIDLVEGLTTAKLPLPLPQIMLATVWVRDSMNDTLQMRVRMENPRAEEIGSFTIPEERFPPHIKRQRMNISLEGLPIDLPGDYWVVVDHRSGAGWVEVGRVPLEVQISAMS